MSDFIEPEFGFSEQDRIKNRAHIIFSGWWDDSGEQNKFFELLDLVLSNEPIDLAEYPWAVNFHERYWR